MRNPYVTGVYVTGHRHYGRRQMLDYLLHGEDHAYWVIGNRRMGKTSLLRQLELLAQSEPHWLPIYWDMQGCDTFARLGQYLRDAIGEQKERFEALELPLSLLDEEDVPTLLASLRRAAYRKGLTLFLLCDETEALIKLARTEPEAMQRLHRELTAGAGLRVVATSTRAIYQMHDICHDWPTSPFLTGFDMSQTLSSLSPPSAHALITQAQAPADERVQAAPEVIQAICDYTNNHPYLLQLLCSRLFQPEGWLRPVTDEDLEVDPLLAGFFRNDFNSLTEADRQVIWAVHQANIIAESDLHQIVGGSRAEFYQRVHNLERLGHLRRVHSQGVPGLLAIGNQFLVNWLSAEDATLRAAPAAATSEQAARVAVERQHAQELNFLVSRLNARRERLVELEAIRARDFLAVSPHVLTEIEEVQTDIRRLRHLLDEIRQV